MHLVLSIADKGDLGIHLFKKILSVLGSFQLRLGESRHLSKKSTALAGNLDLNERYETVGTCVFLGWHEFIP